MATRALQTLAAGVLAVSLLAGCGDDTETGSGTSAPPGGTSTVDDTPSSTDPSDGGPPRTGQADVAVADLAARLDVEADDVVVVSVDAVTWRDSSLGCPQRGFQYMQVLTEGVRIVLEVDGTRYSYHGGASGDPFYCATPEAPQSVG